MLNEKGTQNFKVPPRLHQPSAGYKLCPKRHRFHLPPTGCAKYNPPHVCHKLKIVLNLGSVSSSPAKRVTVRSGFCKFYHPRLDRDCGRRRFLGFAQNLRNCMKISGGCRCCLFEQCILLVDLMDDPTLRCPRPQFYLAAAALHVWRSTLDRSGIESIVGIWVSSDDSSVLPEVKALAQKFFPNIQEDKIISISFRDNGPEHPKNLKDELSTTSVGMVSRTHEGNSK